MDILYLTRIISARCLLFSFLNMHASTFAKLATFHITYDDSS